MSFMRKMKSKTQSHCHITVPTAPTARPSDQRRSGQMSYVPRFYWQLAQEDDNAKHLDYVFSTEHNHVILNGIEGLNDNPQSLAEAQSHSDWPLWQEAMDRELAALDRAGTWCTVEHLPDMNIIGCKWVFCIKQRADGSINKYKVHLVA